MGGTVIDVNKVDEDGFTAGGQIEYNYQFGASGGVVIGIVADAAYTDLSKTGHKLGIAVPPLTIDGADHGQLDYLGTVRGRLGYAFDRFLVYGTGGFAYEGVKDSLGVFAAGTSFAPAALLASGRVDRTGTGFAYGGGVEYALPTDNVLNIFHSSAVTVRAEYLHYDLGSAAVALVTPTGIATGNSTQISTEGDLVRAGINYKF